MGLELLNSELRIFAKSLLTLAKVGEVIFFLWEDKLSVRIVNPIKSGFVDITYDQDFFNAYKKPNVSKNFKISSKAVMKVFSCTSFIEKNVISCSIKLSPDSTYLFVKFQCAHELYRSFRMPITDCRKKVAAVYDKKATKNHLTVPTKILSEVMTVFRSDSDEIVMQINQENCLIKNAVDFGQDSKAIETQVILENDEFSRYQVDHPNSEYNFTLKELKTILPLIDYLSKEINIDTQESGFPVIFSCTDNKLYSLELVLATSLSGQPSSSGSSLPTMQVDLDKPKSKSLKRTREKTPPISNNSPNLELNFFEQTNEPTPQSVSVIGESPIYDFPNNSVFTQSCTILNEGNVEAKQNPVKRAKSCLFDHIMQKENIDKSVEVNQDESCSFYCPSPIYANTNELDTNEILVPDSDRKRNITLRNNFIA